MKRIFTVAAIAAPVVTLGLVAAMAVPSVAGASTTSASSTPTDGSVSLTLTSPRAITKTHSAAVTCKTADGKYVAGGKIIVRGVPVRLIVSVPNYDGPGSYSSSTMSLTSPGRYLVRQAKSPAVITSTGGSYTFDRTGRYGAEWTGTASWTCSS